MRTGDYFEIIDFSMENLTERIEGLKKFFGSSAQLQEKYLKIIELGKNLPPFLEAWKAPEYLVSGCQSQLYLYPSIAGEGLFFAASSDALISAGLAAVLIQVYSGLTPLEILRHPPTFLEELGISSALSMNRSQGARHIYLRMRHDALQNLSRH